jgi:hypothetical protein
MSIQQRELAPGHLLAGAARNTGKEWIVVAGETITAGQLVCANGVSEAHVMVMLAAANSSTKRHGPIFVAMHGASAGDQLRVGEYVVQTNVNTGGSAAGAPIFLSNTAGAWGLSAGAVSLHVGVVLVVDATAGAVLVTTPRGAI